LAREMSPDVVIAIHLQVSPTTAEDIQSLFGVLGRSIQISSAASEIRGMEAADLVVKVDVQKFTALDFNQADALWGNQLYAFHVSTDAFPLIRQLGCTLSAAANRPTTATDGLRRQASMPRRYVTSISASWASCSCVRSRSARSLLTFAPTILFQSIEQDEARRDYNL